MESRKIFVTGNPGCGKTTLVKKIVSQLKRSYTGFITEEIRKNNERTGFKIIDLVTGDRGLLAGINQKGGPKVSKYSVNIEDLERIAVTSMEREAELYVIDEIGKMEMCSLRFKLALDSLLRSDKDVLATLGKYYAKDYESIGEIIWLSRHNFNKVIKELLKRLE